jgi:hypothetical protein
MKAGYGADMLLAVMSAFGCTPRGDFAAASDAPVFIDGAFILQGQGMSGDVVVTDAAGAEVPIRVAYDEPYDGLGGGDRVAVTANDGWEPGGSYVAGVERRELGSVWWDERSFIVASETAPQVTGTPEITLDEVIDHSGESRSDCDEFSHEYIVTLTPASADPSGWSTLLVEHRTGQQDFFDLTDGPATVTTWGDGLDYCLRVTQIDATGARSSSEWTCAEEAEALEPCGCGSDASAFLFVGVVGLGLKRRTRPSR